MAITGRLNNHRFAAHMPGSYFLTPFQRAEAHALFLIVTLLASCTAISPSKPRSDPTPNPSPTNAPVECSTPLPTDSPPSQLATISPANTKTGVCIYGYVALNEGPGLANVRIYLSLAAYGGEIVAITDPNGDFLSDLKFIPGDENVTVWAELDGYNFSPSNFHWRHYHGLEERNLNFTAQENSATTLP